jgi:hypothetical protein
VRERKREKSERKLETSESSLHHEEWREIKSGYAQLYINNEYMFTTQSNVENTKESMAGAIHQDQGQYSCFSSKQNIFFSSKQNI